VVGITIALLGSGLVSLGGSAYLVSVYGGTADGLERNASLLAGLREHVVSEALVLSSAAGDPARLLAAAGPGSIDSGFAQAEAVSSPAAVRSIREARSTWDAAVASILRLRAGLSSVQRTTAIGTVLSTQAPKVLTLLDQAAADGRATARGQLSGHGRRAAWVLGGLALISLLGLGLLIRFGRRLSHQVLEPVDRLRSSVDRLAGGELSHRIEVSSEDELGALAVSFNSMADSIAGSQHVLSRQANHDSLTGLANGPAFRRRAEECLTTTDRRDGTLAVLFLDLDNFKYVNDSFGHAAGDELLKVVATRLASVVRSRDVLARLGGDEFAILLDGIPDVRAAVLLAERAVAALATPVDLGADTVRVGVSIGVAMRHVDSHVGSLMQQADTAMYSAKGHGKNRVECYDPSLYHAEIEHRALKSDINAAAGRDELVLDYQPVFNLHSGEMVAVEALVRWQHPTRGLLPPSDFIALAEQTGAIVTIGAWVLRAAADQLCNWQRRYGQPRLAVAVNVSACQLRAPDFPELVRHILDASGLEPVNLILEVTESVLVDDTSSAAAALGELRQMGIRISIDDFGTGFASIGYLRTLPVDILKIDRSFVSGPKAQGLGVKLLAAVVALGREMDLEVIPEGIEHPDELVRLRALGCDTGQGFLLSRPVTAEKIDEWLAGTNHPLPIEFFEEQAGRMMSPT
jgi:diguanylate cyclase (GGDEF)-like protein